MKEQKFFRDTVSDLLQKTNGKSILSDKGWQTVLGIKRRAFENLVGTHTKDITVYQMAKILLGE